MAGYKMKSHRGAAKRFSFTASGKVKRDPGFGSHLLTTKKGKRMRRLTKASYCNKTDGKMIRELLPYK